MTMILVTHDQEEAMTVSDRIFVMNQGIFGQEGYRPKFMQPRTEFVANFIGRYNVFSKEQLGKLIGKNAEVSADKYAIRPEAIHVQAQSSAFKLGAIAGDSIMNGNVIRTTFHGIPAIYNGIAASSSAWIRKRHGISIIRRTKGCHCFIMNELKEERQRLIIQWVNEEKRVSVGKLATKLSVTPETIAEI